MEEQRSSVPEMAKHERGIPSFWDWIEPLVWTDKMLAALERGVKGKAKSLIVMGSSHSSEPTRNYASLLKEKPVF